ncbi:MAG: (d)CMP kinase [Pseudomonadota bacterium]|nr:(d)CMP kinase [Pseudomonadota bacterium]
MYIPVLTIDGPSGVGKGSASLKVGQQLGWHLLESGALYRALALMAQEAQVALDDEVALTQLANQLEVTFEAQAHEVRVWLKRAHDETDITQALRHETYAHVASQIAVLPQVRQALLERQRAFRQIPGLVAEGRDMGTVVFPEATVKIFLTASVEERAQRRYKQLKEKGISVKLSTLSQDIAARDQRDSMRPVAPLSTATDAWVIDTTRLSIEEVVANILKQVSPYT